MMKRPTQADVARLAGVSQSTVSMVLNQRDGGAILISDETVEKVRSAMRALGYAPDPVAQMLAQGRNRLIAVFNYDSTSSYLRDGSYHKILVGIEDGSGQQDYNILLLTRDRAEPRRSVFQRGINNLRLADGAILMGFEPNVEDIQRLAGEGYPFVYIGRRDIPGVDLNWVSSDYRAAGMEATQHLIDLGHRRMAYVCSRTAYNSASFQARWQGCQAALAAVPGAELVLVDQADVSTPDGLRSLLQANQISALLCNDAENLNGAMQSLAQTTLRVPEDVSVLSLGDTLGHFATSMSVTCVHLNQEAVGAEAVRRLVARVDGTTPTHQIEQILVPCEFVVGDSTGIHV